MDTDFELTRIGDGVYRVVHEGQNEIVFVAGSSTDRWAFWNGHVFRAQASEAMEPETRPVHRRTAGSAGQPLTTPMPATVIKVLVAPGAQVKKGETVLLLEAMKMELPIRALADGTVVAVHCREGDLVQPDTPLIELK